MAEMVTDYLENALPLQRRIAARLHLFNCPAFTRYFTQMRRTIGLLRAGRPPPPAPDTEDAIVQRLGADSPL